MNKLVSSLKYTLNIIPSSLTFCNPEESAAETFTIYNGNITKTQF